MVIDIVAIGVTALLSILLANVITRSLEFTGLLQLFVELYCLVTALLVLVYFSIMSMGAALLATGLMGIIGLVGLGHKKRQRKKARNGELGEEVKWATELIEDEDEMFIVAVNALEQTEMKEVGIIAESKEELRELTIERLDEKSDNNIPGDFIQ